MPLDAYADIRYVFTADFARTIDGVREGILRFLDRAENVDLWAAMTGNSLALVYQQAIGDAIFEAMGAEVWLCQSLCSFDMYEVWMEAFYQAAAVLCLDDVEESYE